MKTFSLFPEEPQKPSFVSDAEGLLAGLNPSQREAVINTDGAVMIIAGAGSGKTRTVMYRIAYLLALRKAFPSQIMALTFTNKAAKEMLERIEKLVGAEQAKGLWMGTFHSIFSRILRREAEAIQYTSDFSIYDSDDAQQVIKQLMIRNGIDTKAITPRAIHNRISGAKNQLITPAEYGRLVSNQIEEAAAKLYLPYQEMLKKSNAMDFDDLLLKPIELFERFPDVLARYQERWKYLHIDEYQDTNRAQYTLTKMLAAKHGNICVVGDDAQSIYAFRGADITNILDYQNDYKEAKVVRLEQNYRSTKKILQLADSVIKQNQDQLEKTLWTDNATGDDITLFEAISEKDEAQKIEQAIQHIHLNFGLPYKGFAILYRTNAQSRSLEDGLRRSGVPYRIFGGINFYQRKEIKDAIAYLRLLVNPNDNESLRRVINYPVRGIGEKTVQRIAEFGNENNLTMWQSIERLEEIKFAPNTHASIEKFRFMIGKYASKLETMSAAELARGIIADAGLMTELRAENTVEALARWENVQELLNAIAEFETDLLNAYTPEGESVPTNPLSRFLQEISLLTDADKTDGGDNKVTLMTLHASKGLEFPVVFLAGLEENLFPLQASTQERKDLEEERRLFYVGITRAQEKLFLSYARSRFKFGRFEDAVRSRFVEELDASVIKMEGGRRFDPKGSSRNSYGNQGYSNQGYGTKSYGNQGYGNKSYGNQAANRPALSNQGFPKKQQPVSPMSRPTPAPKPVEPTRQLVYDDVEGGQIVTGMKVLHETFGQGKVLSVEGAGERAKATIYFKDVGQKKLVLKFARLQVIG
jgi:DNA helicase-2/ATP-dependent DNA helicase PcrA